jgi:hypothetical protein
MKKLSAALLVVSMLGTSSAYAQTCAGATEIFSNQTVNADTSGATNWMSSFGPVVSPSNDVVYKFTAHMGQGPLGLITPTASSYQFALYLIPSCNEVPGGQTSVSEPAPIGNTATVGTGINVGNIAQVTDGNTYFLAVTGTAAGGAGANGTVTFTTGTLPVTLQGFSVE